MRRVVFFVIVTVALVVTLTPSFSHDADAITARQRLTSVGVGATGAGFAEATATTLPEKIGAIIKIFLSLIGVIFLVLLVHGGYKYMTAGGNEEDIKKAKHEITAAIIGLIIVVAAWSISQFLLLQFIKAVKEAPPTP